MIARHALRFSHQLASRYIPHVTQQTAVAWLLGFVVRPSVTGLVAKTAVASSANAGRRNFRASRYVASTASVIAIGLIQYAMIGPSVGPPIHSDVATSSGRPSGYFG